MKKLLFVFISLLFVSNVYAEEIQLTDYNFTYAKRMFDGYSYIAYSDYHSDGTVSGKSYERIESNILKPNATLLYNPEDYEARYVIGNNGEFDFNIPQSISGDKFKVTNTYQAYLPVPDRTAQYFLDKEGNNLGYIDNNGDYVSKKENNEPPTVLSYDEVYGSYKMNHQTEESESERVDKSYTFKEKEINGTKYYALFKELTDTETAEDYKSTEQPTEKYTEYIDKMADDGLLFNNEMCFYKRGITKLDFGIVLGRAYCKAMGYNIDDFVSDTKFDDVNNPYCLLLADDNILNSDNNLYVNEKEISKKTVSDALERLAKRYSITTEWNAIKVIQPSDLPCSRELAYVETFRLYDLIKQHCDSEYTSFQASAALDSDSEAETLSSESTVATQEATEKSTEVTSYGESDNEDKETLKFEIELVAVLALAITAIFLILVGIIKFLIFKKK